MTLYSGGFRVLLLSACVIFGMSMSAIANAQEDQESEAPAPEGEEATASDEGAAAPDEEAPAAEEESTEETAGPPAPMDEAVETEEGGTLEVEENPEPVAAPEEDENVEEIVVTGSRIRSALDKPAPILDLNEEDIDRAGLTSIADVLQQLPVSGGALNMKFNSSGNFGFPPDGGGIGAGAAQIDLRYLTSKRVLVLVDGVRWVNGSSASGVAAATDLNTIPVGIIDRIEILEDGASAIYGSDAIAGVVNIITKKDFQGWDANAYWGGYLGYWDGGTQQYDLTWGDKTDKMTMLLSMSYVRQNAVNAKDRDIAKYPVPNIGGCGLGCSSGTPQGRFFFIDPNTGYMVDVTTDPFTDPTSLSYDPDAYASSDSTSYIEGTDSYHGFSNDDRFNFAPYNYVQAPSQRLGVFSQIRYELTNHFNIHARALFNNRRSKNQAAPEPLFIGSEAGTGSLTDQISVDATNPYNPFGFTLDAQNMSYFIGRRPLEAGPRKFEQNVNTFYLAGGFDGDFTIGQQAFFWDTTVVYATNRADQLKHGAFNAAKLQKALGPVDECEADGRCVPFNIFGGQGVNGEGTITQEMLDYVTFVQKDLSHQQLVDVSANISGGLFDLPGGTVGLALGGEFRYLDGYFVPDPVVAAGDSAGVPSSPTSGDYNAIEGYAELLIPLVADVPGLNLLDVSGAVRVSNYSTFGTVGTFKVGGRWKPFEDLLFRGSFAQGFRAPSIGELYGSEARFDQVLDDPCSDLLGQEKGATPASPEVFEHCTAMGVPEDGSYTQINSQISVTTGGNRDLEPETSKGVTISGVYSMSWATDILGFADQFDLELGYYWIELDDAISAIDAQVQLDACYRTGDPIMCEGISRTGAGTINGFNNQLTNIGGITTDGIDLNLTYVSPDTAAGRFRAMIMTHFLLRYDEKLPSAEGYETIERLGREIGDPERAYPPFKGTLILGWMMGDFGVSLTNRYIHSVTEECRDLQQFGVCSDYDEDDDTKSENVIDPIIYTDVQLSWTPTVMDKTELLFSAGINNVFNQDPPFCYSCALNGFDASTYEIPGMFGYLKVGCRL